MVTSEVDCDKLVVLLNSFHARHVTFTVSAYQSYLQVLLN